MFQNVQRSTFILAGAFAQMMAGTPASSARDDTTALHSAFQTARDTIILIEDAPGAHGHDREMEALSLDELQGIINTLPNGDAELERYARALKEFSKRISNGEVPGYQDRAADPEAWDRHNEALARDLAMAMHDDRVNWEFSENACAQTTVKFDFDRDGDFEREFNRIQLESLIDSEKQNRSGLLDDHAIFALEEALAYFDTYEHIRNIQPTECLTS